MLVFILCKTCKKLSYTKISFSIKVIVKLLFFSYLMLNIHKNKSTLLKYRFQMLTTTKKQTGRNYLNNIYIKTVHFLNNIGLCVIKYLLKFIKWRSCFLNVLSNFTHLHIIKVKMHWICFNYRHLLKDIILKQLTKAVKNKNSLKTCKTF